MATKMRPGPLPATYFIPGDVVSRDGTDEHLVVSTNEDGAPGFPPDLILVRCIKAPSSGWAKIGEEENNLSRRYHLVRRPSGTISTL